MSFQPNDRKKIEDKIVSIYKRRNRVWREEAKNKGANPDNPPTSARSLGGKEKDTTGRRQTGDKGPTAETQKRENELRQALRSGRKGGRKGKGIFHPSS